MCSKHILLWYNLKISAKLPKIISILFSSAWYNYSYCPHADSMGSRWLKDMDIRIMVPIMLPGKICICLQKITLLGSSVKAALTYRQTDGRTDRRTDGRTQSFFINIDIYIYIYIYIQGFVSTQASLNMMWKVI